LAILVPFPLIVGSTSYDYELTSAFFVIPPGTSGILVSMLDFMFCLRRLSFSEAEDMVV